MKCLICNKQFNPRQKTQKYCSNTCNQHSYYLRHKKKYLERRKEYNRTHPEILRAATLRWKKKYPEKNRAIANRWAKKNQEYVLWNASIQNSRRKGASGYHTLKEWQELKKKHNYTCLKCGKKEPDIKLTQDHKIPIKHGGTNNISNIQPLCFKCNASKGAHI